mmetsp:Transcript_27394/g.64408  ORF Transcript_27394/g.64408 Transcript_27394/m.64408 type:complete len:205 (+) Transcript_27394:218-832(+)
MVDGMRSLSKRKIPIHEILVVLQEVLRPGEARTCRHWGVQRSRLWEGPARLTEPGDIVPAPRDSLRACPERSQLSGDHAIDSEALRGVQHFPTRCRIGRIDLDVGVEVGIDVPRVHPASSVPSTHVAKEVGDTRKGCVDEGCSRKNIASHDRGQRHGREALHLVHVLNARVHLVLKVLPLEEPSVASWRARGMLMDELDLVPDR